MEEWGTLTETEEHDQNPSEHLPVHFPDCLVFFPPGPTEIRIELFNVLRCQLLRIFTMYDRSPPNRLAADRTPLGRYHTLTVGSRPRPDLECFSFGYLVRDTRHQSLVR